MRLLEVGTGGRVFILFWLCPPTQTASRFTQDFEKDPEDSSPCQLPYSGSYHKSTPSPSRRLDLGVQSLTGSADSIGQRQEWGVQGTTGMPQNGVPPVDEGHCFWVATTLLERKRVTLMGEGSSPPAQKAFRPTPSCFLLAASSLTCMSLSSSWVGVSSGALEAITSRSATPQRSASAWRGEQRRMLCFRPDTVTDHRPGGKRGHRGNHGLSGALPGR